MTSTWLVVIVSSVGAYALKLAGYLVPAPVLARPSVRRVAALLPVALLAALVAVQTFAAAPALVVDARLAGVAAAVVALTLRAPFLIVIAIAAAVAAGARALGWS
ncbi:MAG: AzlD domain-containing protein [Actinomycetales bacterium]|nr:AzlD domain-containing protein [Actinomycetales bacterium]